MSPCPLCETGSRLFDASVVGEDTRLALNFPVKKFKSEKSNYFRAHPAFLRCLQKTVNWVYQGSRKTVSTQLSSLVYSLYCEFYIIFDIKFYEIYFI